MKKLSQFLLISCVGLLSFKALSQNNCSTPYLFASGIAYTYSLDTNTVNLDTLNYGCLAAQPNPLWLYFGVCNTGLITINTSPYNGSTDLDYIVWGPLTDSLDCNLLPSQIVTCSYSVGTNNITFNVQFGYYKILITNFSNLLDTIIISQSSGTAIACDTTYTICPTISAHQLCKVTTDNLINKNTISWVEDSLFVGEFNVQKETTTSGVYSTIGNVLSGNPSTFTDTISNPVQQAFRYRLETVDTCGVVKISNYHQTIHLATSVNPVTNYPQLTWNPYIGFSYSTYYIYRGTSSTTIALYDSISTSFTAYTDVNPMVGSLYYAIGVNLPSPCTYLGSFKSGVENAMSNISPVTLVSIDEYNTIGFNLYPNPTKNNLIISFGTEMVTAKMNLMDIYGRLILSKEYINVNKDILDFSELNAGLYIITLSSEKGMGRKTFIKTN
ncbi:MAG: hypothetical protein A3K10_16800 [Bacteroidetes bacterium RIFCSPLOWO2_12_FULL_31_6]|nr:MAG: hypothetical protein A3K10_16800 [Bacteroidetes bacterium RIFCSPLOWO2_12_FULL_31_6]